ncbi:hypothetical protein GCM10023084_81360 [Streptomyces lacrimifluminis]|uniref:Uncharacterized protein n=1 Tax=Streptomyces lacrimifluminis TaxID=1500077 RepID=A0A917PCS9_9ACTN|nr:hypothetical protein GCM10012282_80190 [Streptomyces lacrimifluminis]
MPERAEEAVRVCDSGVAHARLRHGFGGAQGAFAADGEVTKVNDPRGQSRHSQSANRLLQNGVDTMGSGADGTGGRRMAGTPVDNATPANPSTVPTPTAPAASRTRARQPVDAPPRRSVAGLAQPSCSHVRARPR